jgi:DNA invertase Pin-like site-specific DNA recombinase
MAKIGYARVSTADQNLDGQIDRLSANHCDRIFVDVASGGRADRPQFLAMIDYLRQGDTLIVLKFDRFGRSLKHLLETVDVLDRKGVTIHSLTEGFDTTTTGGRLMLRLFGAIAEFERDLIRERTQIGLSAARARGRKGGRPPKLNAEQIDLLKLAAADKSQSLALICKTFGISESTYYRYIG